LTTTILIALNDLAYGAGEGLRHAADHQSENPVCVPARPYRDIAVVNAVSTVK
jgi:hypothetical protein